MPVLRTPTLLTLALPLAAFAIGVLTHPEVPGIYMDSVNPDYTVVALINPSALPIHCCVSGNFLWNKLAILDQLYCGSLTAWVGLPGYALFGTDALGIRLTHGTFGALIIVSSWFALVSYGVSQRIIAAALTALALDPGFLFTFRTQAYITMLPAFLLLLAVAAAARAERGVSVERQRLLLAISGFCAGLSVFGYFFYLFYAAVLAGVVAWQPETRAEMWGRIAIWIGGAFVGLSPMLLGYILVFVSQGGLSAGFQYMAANIQTLHVVSEQPSFGEKLAAGFAAAVSILDSSYHTSLMLGRALPSYGWNLKLAILLWIPALLFGLEAARRRAQRAPGELALLLFVPVISLSAVFGGRIIGHHFAPVVPLLYCWAAATYSSTLENWAKKLASLAGLLRAVAVLALGLASWINAANSQIIISELTLTGGVGLYSDTLTRFGEEARADRGKAEYVLPDWGVFFPFVMLTRGEVAVTTSFAADPIRRTLCSGTQVVVAVLPGGADERIAHWTAEMQWTAPSIARYSERSGKSVLVAARWEGRSTVCHDPACNDRNLACTTSGARP